MRRGLVFVDESPEAGFADHRVGAGNAVGRGWGIVEAHTDGMTGIGRVESVRWWRVGHCRGGSSCLAVLVDESGAGVGAGNSSGWGDLRFREGMSGAVPAL